MRLSDLYNKIAVKCNVKPPSNIVGLADDRANRQLYYEMLNAVDDLLGAKDFPDLVSIAYDMTHLGYIDRHGNIVSTELGNGIPTNAVASRFQLPDDFLRPVRSKTVYNETDEFIGEAVQTPIAWQLWADQTDGQSSYINMYRLSTINKTLDTMPPIQYTETPPEGDTQFFNAAQSVPNQTGSILTWTEIHEWPLDVIMAKRTSQIRIWNVTGGHRVLMASTNGEQVHNLPVISDGQQYINGQGVSAFGADPDHLIIIGRTTDSLAVVIVKTAPSVPNEQLDLSMTLTDAGEIVRRGSTFHPNADIQFNYISSHWLQDPFNTIDGRPITSDSIGVQDDWLVRVDPELLYYRTCYRFYRDKTWPGADRLLADYEYKLGSKYSDQRDADAIIMGSGGYRTGNNYIDDADRSLPWRATDDA